MPNGEGGHDIVCIQSCPEPSADDEVCAEDFGVYPSRCHMEKETCEMYGVDVMVGVVDDHNYCKDANHLGRSGSTNITLFQSN